MECFSCRECADGIKELKAKLKKSEVAYAQNRKIWPVFKGLWSKEQTTSVMPLGDIPDVLPK